MTPSARSEGCCRPARWIPVAVILFALQNDLTVRAEADDDPLSGPWSSSSNAPVIVPHEVEPSAQDRRGTMGATFGFLWLHFYQKGLSVMVSSHCPMWPSCSNYSMQAIAKHGVARGMIMTADRLLHEADEWKYATIIRKGDRLLYADPVENNETWSLLR